MSKDDEHLRKAIDHITKKINSYLITDDLGERLQTLAEFLPMFEGPEFSFGHWSEFKEVRPGVMEMPYFCYSKVAWEFLNATDKYGWVLKGFDWPTWKATTEAIQLRDDPKVLNKATPEQLAYLLTVIIRQDRFCEGAIASAYKTGLITAICRRAAQLLSEIDEDEETK